MGTAISLGDVLTQRTESENVKYPANEKFVTISLYGLGARQRSIGAGKTPRPFRGSRVKAGDFIYSRIDARHGAFALIPDELDGAVVSKDFPIFDIHHDRIDSNYLMRLVSNGSFYAGIENLSFGATNRQRVGESTLLSFEIPLPPLPEQRRIAAILDQADELRTKRRRTLGLLDELADALFADMFGGAFAQGELRIRRLNEVTDVDDRINYGVVQPGDGVIDGIPLIRVGDLKMGGIRDGSLKQISKDIEKEYVRSRIRGTEILVSCVGSIGEVSTVSVEHIGFNVARAVARVPIADPVQRAYVAAALRSSPIQAYFKNETRTVSQPTLNIRQLAGTPIPWPKRSDMSVFHDRISKLRTAHRVGRQHDAQLDELFASLQHRAFRGEL